MTPIRQRSPERPFRSQATKNTGLAAREAELKRAKLRLGKDWVLHPEYVFNPRHQLACAK